MSFLVVLLVLGVFVLLVIALTPNETAPEVPDQDEEAHASRALAVRTQRAYLEPAPSLKDEAFYVAQRIESDAKQQIQRITLMLAEKGYPRSNGVIKNLEAALAHVPVVPASETPESPPPADV